MRLRHIESSPNFCQQAPARSQTNRYATGEVEAYLPSNHLLFVGGRQRQAGVEAGVCRSGCRCINIFGGLTGGHKVQLTATHTQTISCHQTHSGNRKHVRAQQWLVWQSSARARTATQVTIEYYNYKLDLRARASERAGDHVGTRDTLTHSRMRLHAVAACLGRGTDEHAQSSSAL